MMPSDAKLAGFLFVLNFIVRVGLFHTCSFCCINLAGRTTQMTDLVFMYGSAGMVTTAVATTNVMLIQFVC